ncbi:hypothetical protein, conserved [Plasmodium gonderi]|uniref:CBF1-interacting co-repressor CIR N-terminal domain-containing protein n=1 Tax=Plasmodium gonderi TaxID=77519 RepID=A0A1Y1JHI3_PLAGO|nr:hypothetical protein, conserved [Plasmodium gonderi]GAW80677.1 hypothetical protein, conserved [Plasmodium gonderi]
MGGHGGLNILPQKKWNVYRKDRQYKVNYDENKLIKEEEKKVKKKNEQTFEKAINQLKENAHQSSAYRNSSHKNDTFEKDTRRKYIYQNNKEEDRTHYCEHINLFAEEEKEINERNKMHEEFLIKKGHYIYNDKNFNGENCIYDKTNNAKIVSDFDKIKISQNEWLMKRQSSIFLNKNEYNELKGEKKYDYFYDNISQKKTDHSKKSDSSENESHRERDKDRDKLKYRDRKKKKEKKKKYDHIKKLIKYKRDKEKKEKKKNRKK